MYTGPARIAHRGNVKYAPENTWTAILEAVLSGSEGIEVDLRRTKDGRIVVTHDGNTKRMTCRERGHFFEIQLSETTWDDLHGLTIPFANHLMPRLDQCPENEAELLELIETIQMDSHKDYNFRDHFQNDRRQERFLLLEEMLKRLQNRFWTGLLELELKDTGLMPELDRILRNYDLPGPLYLMSGSEEIILEIQDFYRNRKKPEKVGLAANIKHLNEEWKSRINTMDLAQIGLNAWLFGKEDVDFAQSRGIRVFSNLGDTHSWWKVLQTLGIAGFKTNHVDEYTKWWSCHYEKL